MKFRHQLSTYSNIPLGEPCKTYLPYHSVDGGVERLSLLPEYTEDKAVEAGPDEANNGPPQPDIAVRVALDLWVVKVAGAESHTFDQN